MFPLFLLFALIVIQRLSELQVAKRNYAWAMAQGATEYGAGHYWLFIVLHTGWLIGWLAEGWWRGGTLANNWWLWLGLFVMAQALRYWALTSLGKQWNTRILILPNAERIARGPYKLLPHPNYIAVVIELLSVPLIFGAWWTALIASVLNAVILLGVRIPAENKALEDYANRRSA